MILKQFDGAAVAPRDDAILNNAIIKKNGVFKGVKITHLGSNQLHITAGYGIIKGRVWEQEEETIYCNLASSGTSKGRAYIHMDLTDTETPIQIMTVAAESLPDLIQDEDCNYTNGIYEIELCTYDVSDLAISNLEVTYTSVTEIFPVIRKLTDLAALTESGFLVDALVAAELNKNIDAVLAKLQHWIDNGELSPESSLYLIRKAVMNTDVVGWNGYSVMTMTLAGEFFYLPSSYNCRSLFTSAKVDLTKYSKLKIKMYHSATLAAYAYLGVSSVGGFGTSAYGTPDTLLDEKVSCNGGTNIGTYTLDISNLSGDYYICYCGKSSADFKVYIGDIWLE